MSCLTTCPGSSSTFPGGLSLSRFLKILGPGLITGASDDDPSGLRRGNPRPLLSLEIGPVRRGVPSAFVLRQGARFPSGGRRPLRVEKGCKSHLDLTVRVPSPVPVANEFETPARIVRAPAPAAVRDVL